MNKIFTLGLALMLFAGTLQAQTWSSQTSGTAQDIWGASFVNATTGWVSGANGTILHTTDGGTTWNPQTSGVLAPHILRNIFFLTPNIGWSVGDSGKIVKTINGGTLWSNQTSGTTQVLREVRFIDANNGWASGANGTILHTTDGGTTWNAQTSGAPTESLMSIKFTDLLNGWAAGSAGASPPGVILHTSDGGTTWTPQTAPATNNLNGCTMANATNGWMGGTSGVVFHTTDGSTWAAQACSTTGTIRGMASVSITDAWAVLDGGEIFGTSDGGTTWAAQTSGTTQTLRGTFFYDINNGWAVGNAGTILKYSNTVGINSVKTNEMESISIYPNPATHNIIVKHNLIESGIVKVDILSLTGEILMSQLNNMVEGTNTTVFSLAALSNGVYFIRVKNNDHISTQKFILDK